MVLQLATKGSKDLPLKQRDVRETAGISGTPIIGDFTSSQHSHAAAGATGGTVDHANLTSIGTNSHAQVDTHIGNTANPHSVVLTDLASPGEGIDFSGTDIQGENASDTNKGIAVFPIADFTVTAGSVALKAIVVTSIDGDSGTATPAIHNIDILGGDGISTAGAGNNLTITNTNHAAVGVNTTHVAGNGADHADVASNTTHRSSNGTNHANVVTNTANIATNTADIVTINATIGNKTSYWSCTGAAFVTPTLKADEIRIENLYGYLTVLAAGGVIASVNLPQGAIITEVIGYGNVGIENELYYLYRTNLSTGAAESIAYTNFNTADTSITNATVDNSTYAYYIHTSSLDIDDEIYGIKITYTTDYI